MTPPARKTQRASRAAGFTLVELMVALAVGGIVIGAMYAMGATSTRTFQVQHQIANMQASLRFAYVQLKRDIMRAGFHAVPNASMPNSNVCNPIGLPVGLPGGGGWYAGVSSFRDNVAPNIVDPTGVNLNTPANGFSRDEVTLIGNYATANQYPKLRVISATTVALSTVPGDTSHALQVDFGWAAANGVATTAINAVEVQRAFPAGGLIRIYTRTGRTHLATLDVAPTVTANDITFSFSPGLGPCIEAAKDGWIAPLRVVRYGVTTSAAGSWDTDRVTRNTFAQLTRSTMQPPNMNAVLDARPILDYVATFNLAFAMTPPSVLPLVADNYVIGQRATPAQVNANPESVRSVEVELGVRATDVDPGLTFPCPDQGCMALFPTAVAGSPAARVRVLRSEVFLPNIAYEGR